MHSRRSLCFLFTAFLCLALVPWSWASEPGTAITGKVVAVSDGDTITILTSENEQVKVRLHGIDTPESGQPFGNNAKQFTSEQCFGKTVRVEVTDTDRYGRTVGNVFVNGSRNLNQALVGAGLAWWYKQYAPNDLHLMKLQADATVERRGMWGGSEIPIPPWEWRSGQRGATLPDVADISNARGPDYSSPTPQTVTVSEEPAPYTPNLKAPASGSGMVYITKSGRKYHREDCRYTANGASPMRLATAQTQGYGPCSVCKPMGTPGNGETRQLTGPKSYPQQGQIQLKTPAAQPPTTQYQSAPPSQVQPQMQAQPETPAQQVYVTRTGEKYHRAGCRYLSKSQIPMDLSSAKARYGACSVCRPPQ